MRPIVIAHRGASGYLPEHTLAAKALAHEMGADYLEQDVVVSRDDVLIVLHDIYLDRVTDVATRFTGRQRQDGRYYARDFDLDEILSLKAWERMRADGSPVYANRYPPKSGDFRLCTLAEELETIQKLNAESGKQVGIYPEIKRPAWHREEGVDIAPMLLKALADFGYAQRSDPVFVQCFDDAEIARLRQELNCPFKLVQLIGENSWGEAATDYDMLRSPRGIRDIAQTADAIGPHLAHLYGLDKSTSAPLANDLVRLAHESGLAVHPYTFRADDIPADFSSFKDLVQFFVADIGVDGLFTDFPDQVVQLRSN